MMNHDKYELLEKKFIKARRELDRIQEQLWSLPYRKLEEPYQSGWDLIVSLRDDFARSAAGPVVQTLLDRFAQHGVIRNPKYVSQIRKKRSLSDVNNLLVLRWISYYGLLGVRDISKKEYESLTQREKKYFEAVPEWARSVYNRRGDYEFTVPRHYLVVRIEKRMVTHIQDIDPILLKRKAELKVILEPYWRRGSRYAFDDHIKNRKERRKSKVETHLMKINHVPD